MVSVDTVSLPVCLSALGTQNYLATFTWTLFSLTLGYLIQSLKCCLHRIRNSPPKAFNWSWFISFFLSTSASEALLHLYEETWIRLLSQVQLREIIFNGIVVDQQFHFEETDTWSLLLKRELTDADILLHVTCILLIMTFPIVQMVSCRGPPQNTGPQAIACLACRIATPLSTTAPVRSPHTSYRWRGESHRASQVDGDD